MNNQIHSTAIVESTVTLGARNTIGPYAVVQGNVTIGDDNWIGPHAVIGTPPEHQAVRLVRGHSGYGPIRIGNRNVLHEFSTVQAPVGDVTSIGSDCFVMNKTYIAHDCLVSDEVTIAPGSLIGGHCVIEPGVNLGLNAVIHQFVTVAELSMVGMGAVVTRDLPPFVVVTGLPARARSLNQVGLERAHLGGLHNKALINVLLNGRDPNEYAFPTRIQNAIQRWMKRIHSG